MPKKISMSLSHDSIQNAIKEIRQYKSDLNKKCEELCRRLTDEGIATANSYIAKSPLGKMIVVQSKINPGKAGCKAMVFAVGQTLETEGYAPFNTLLAVEFGSGIFYNADGNPKAGELGFGVGTFPDQKHAFEDGWFYPSDEVENGKTVWKYTHGVKATMPMYNASKEMREKIVAVAKEVFGA